MRHALFLAAILLSPVAARAAGDAATGKIVFNKCSICHSIKAGENKIGPSLHGVVGRKAASLPGYTYSEAMKKHDVTWNNEALDAYLVDPRKVVPGTKMIFPGLKNETDRANVIAYLDTLK